MCWENGQWRGSGVRPSSVWSGREERVKLERTQVHKGPLGPGVLGHPHLPRGTEDSGRLQPQDRTWSLDSQFSPTWEG